MSEVTRVLSDLAHGDAHAAEQLPPLVYDELRKQASDKLAEEKPNQTLQATVLVHEAHLRLAGVQQVQYWNGRGQYFGAAVEAMRRILGEWTRHSRVAPHCRTRSRTGSAASVYHHLPGAVDMNFRSVLAFGCLDRP